MPEKLKERRGSFVVDHAFGLLITAVVVAIVISVFSVAFQANKLAAMAGDLTRYVEIHGEVNDIDINTELRRLSEAAGLENVSVTVDSGGNQRIQYGDSFTVTLTYTAELDLGGIVSVPIPLRQSVVGRSEMYWK